MELSIRGMHSLKKKSPKEVPMQLSYNTSSQLGWNGASWVGGDREGQGVAFTFTVNVPEPEGTCSRQTLRDSSRSCSIQCLLRDFEGSNMIDGEIYRSVLEKVIWLRYVRWITVQKEKNEKDRLGQDWKVFIKDGDSVLRNKRARCKRYWEME